MVEARQKEVKDDERGQITVPKTWGGGERKRLGRKGKDGRLLNTSFYIVIDFFLVLFHGFLSYSFFLLFLPFCFFKIIIYYNPS
jgi:hypothetical protein